MKSLQILSSHFNFGLLVLWLLNDTFLKSEYPGLVTGKISDIIGVFLSPFIVTAIIHRFWKIEESFLLWGSIIFIAVLFFGINIDQSWNDSFYSFLSFGFSTSGVADPSDLFCLLLLPFTYFRFHSFSASIPMKSKTKIYTLFFSIFVFINTSPLPSGRSNLMDYIFLLNTTYDTLILESPIDSKTVANLESFSFRFISLQNQSKPLSFDSLEIPKECKDVNEVPIKTDSPALNYSPSSRTPSMLFMNYVIEIYKDTKLSEKILSEKCNTQKCELDLTTLPPSEYFWIVQLEYTFIRECKRYSYLLAPNPKPGIFVRSL